jgi:hypothetical protein
MGFQLFVGDKIKYRQAEVANYTKVVVRARITTGPSGKLLLTLIDRDGAAYSAPADLTGNFANVEIPLTTLKSDSCLLLPRPYPGFQPLWFKASSTGVFNISKLDKLQVIAGNDLGPDQYNKPFGIEVESVTLEP